MVPSLLSRWGNYAPERWVGLGKGHIGVRYLTSTTGFSSLWQEVAWIGQFSRSLLALKSLSIWAIQGLVNFGWNLLGKSKNNWNHGSSVLGACIVISNQNIPIWRKARNSYKSSTFQMQIINILEVLIWHSTICAPNCQEGGEFQFPGNNLLLFHPLHKW